MAGVGSEWAPQKLSFRKARNVKYFITEPWVKWVKVVQSCPALCDPADGSPSGSSVQGIFQARILEWVAISFSRGSSWSRDLTQVSCTAGGLYHLRHQASHSIYHIQPSRYLEASLPRQWYKFINWLHLVASGFPTGRYLLSLGFSDLWLCPREFFFAFLLSMIQSDLSTGECTLPEGYRRFSACFLLVQIWEFGVILGIKISWKSFACMACMNCFEVLALYLDGNGEPLKMGRFLWHKGHCLNIQRKPKFKWMLGPQCSLKDYLQKPGHGSNLNVHQQRNG